MQNVDVHAVDGQLHVAHDTAPNEAVAHALQVWEALLVNNARVLQLDIQVLWVCRTERYVSVCLGAQVSSCAVART